MLDDADSLYLEDKTFSSLLTRLHVYISNIPLLLFEDRVEMLTRFLKIFTCGDLIAYNIAYSNSNFRNKLLLKANEMGDAYSDQIGCAELLDEVENIKHIIDEIENDNEEESIENEGECDYQSFEDPLFTDSSDEDIFG